MNKIVLISPCFFNLEKGVISGFEELGYEVTFFDERVSDGKLMKILTRKNVRLINRIISNHYKSIYEYIESNENDIRLLLVVKSSTMPTWFIEKVSKNFPNIKTAHYMWDPIDLNPEIVNKAKYFDKCYTFDRNDSIERGWELRPLFYPDIFISNTNEEQNKEIEFSFIGTLHTDRGEILNNIKNEIRKSTLTDNYYLFYYVPLYVMFIYDKYLKGNHKGIKITDISTKKLDIIDTAKILKKSKFVIDIHHPSQAGLTSRTLEALASRCKIITTNPEVEYYDFYDTNNILIVDRIDPIIPESFLNSGYKEIDESIYLNYTYKSFARTFIEENN